jgi:hypothetical protein
MISRLFASRMPCRDKAARDDAIVARLRGAIIGKSLAYRPEPGEEWLASASDSTCGC